MIPKIELNINADWLKIENDFLSRLNLQSMCHAFVDTCATNLIHNLFEYYLKTEKDCVVLTTLQEHPSVLGQAVRILPVSIEQTISSLSIVNREEQINFFDINNLESIDNLIDVLKNTKKLFLYTKSCDYDTGRIYTNDYLKALKEKIYRINPSIKIIHCLDACQELLIYNRDYSEYDYIIGTAHAIVPGYDMGILVCNKNIPAFGYQITNWLKTYLLSFDETMTNINLKEYKQTFVAKFLEFGNIPSIKINKNSDNDNIISIQIPKCYFTHRLITLKDSLNCLTFCGYGFDGYHSEYTTILFRITNAFVNKIKMMEILELYRRVVDIIKTENCLK